MQNNAVIPSIDNIDMADSAVTYDYTLPNETKRFSIQVVSNKLSASPKLETFRLALNSVDIDDHSFTIPEGLGYFDQDIITAEYQKNNPIVIYLKCPVSNVVAEIFTWCAG
jgi:hypothetical protein